MVFVARGAFLPPAGDSTEADSPILVLSGVSFGRMPLGLSSTRVERGVDCISLASALASLLGFGFLSLVSRDGPARVDASAITEGEGLD